MYNCHSPGCWVNNVGNSYHLLMESVKSKQGEEYLSKKLDKNLYKSFRHGRTLIKLKSFYRSKNKGAFYE